jgi:TPR repeat protein
MIRNAFIAVALSLATLSPASAQDFQSGLEAFNRGDFATALREFRPLAEQGDAIAQNKLGWMYNNGRGVPVDDTEAVRWYRLAAEQGNAYAQHQLGTMYLYGEGVPLDDTEAVRWYRLAAEQGNAYAQRDLGYMYGDGRGVPEDFVTAHMWLNLSAAQGADANKSKDFFAGRMTREQIAEAQRLARECLARNYKGC